MALRQHQQRKLTINFGLHIVIQFHEKIDNNHYIMMYFNVDKFEKE